MWGLIEPLLGPPWPQKAPCPKPVDDRLCLQGILHLHHPTPISNLVVINGTGAPGILLDIPGSEAAQRGRCRGTGRCGRRGLGPLWRPGGRLRRCRERRGRLLGDARFVAATPPTLIAIAARNGGNAGYEGGARSRGAPCRRGRGGARDLGLTPTDAAGAMLRPWRVACRG